MVSVSIRLTQEQLKELESRLGVDLVKIIKDLGGEVEVSEEEGLRFLVLNKGAHDIEGALRNQFGDIEVVYLSEGNIDLDRVEDIALQVAKKYDPSRDVILLSGPAILSALATLLAYIKSPDKVRVAQYDLSKGKYVVFEFSHLKLRSILTKF